MTRISIVAALAVGLTAFTAPSALARAPSPSRGLHVIPFPGTPDASATSEIIFSSLRPAEIVSVTVTGSASGIHPGRVELLPDRAGTAFIPDSPFTAGEHVNITARLSSAAAGTASGAPGATVLQFSFTIGVPAAPASSHTGRSRSALPESSASSGHAPIRRFVSEPGLHPISVTTSADPDHASGDIFLTPQSTIHATGLFRHTYGHGLQGGPMILDDQGGLVWFHPVQGVSANLEVQHYRGQPVLTWWQRTRASSHGEDVIVNQAYRTLAVIRAADGYKADIHEFQITPRGTALIDAYMPVRANLSNVGGATAGIVDDCIIQEIDIRTGKLLWEWHALGHVPPSASYYGRPTDDRPYDYLHLNSIQELPDGDLLFSGRHTWGVYLIDKQTGKIIWTLGGKYSSFKVGPGAQFEWQHDAHLVGDTLTLFDDAAKPGFQEESESSAKEIHLDTATMTATLVHRYSHYPPILTLSQGSVQTLANGNMFVGWGASPEFSEYRAGGGQIFNGVFPLGVESYRAYRFPWTGSPRTPPSIGLVPGQDGTVKIYTSWNGATEIAAWRVLGGSKPGSQHLLGQTQDAGFESSVRLDSEPAYFSVQALNESGRAIGTSAVDIDPAHVAIFSPEAFVNTSSATGSLAVGCFTRHRCRFRLVLSSGGSPVARSTSRVVRSGRATLVEFKLDAEGLRRLSRDGQLRARARLSSQAGGGSVVGVSAARGVTLTPYRVGGSRKRRSFRQSARVRIIQPTGFVSAASGAGQILAACYAPVPCQLRATVSAGGHVVAQTTAEQLGVNEAGAIAIKLTSTGLAMLRRSAGNQLPAQIRLSSPGAKASGQIALVGYR